MLTMKKINEQPFTRAELDRRHRQKHKKAVNERQKQYREKNKKAYNEKQKEYKNKHKEHFSNLSKERYKNNKNWHEEYRAKNKEKIKQYRQQNKDHLNELARIRYEKNKDKMREYRQQNKDKINKSNSKWQKKKRKTDSLYKIKQILRSSVSQSFRRLSLNKPTDTKKLLGCSFEEAKAHIEQLFLEGMCWENYGSWHIDHKRPVSSFAEEELHLMNLIENLQPLWAKDNLKKGSSI